MFWQNFLDRMIRLRATRARRDGAKLTELGGGKTETGELRPEIVVLWSGFSSKNERRANQLTYLDNPFVIKMRNSKFVFTCKSLHCILNA